MKIFGISAPYTGSGKTTVTLALLSKLNNSTSVKIGPDYIDKNLHSSVTNINPYNIDRWLQGPQYRDIFLSSISQFDYAVIEGVMGLYDSGSPMKLNSLYYFRRMKIPYILVVDVYKVAESGYYMAKSFITGLCIGVIINNYAGERHLEMVSKPFIDHGIRIIGAIPHSKEFELPERHLGLSTEIPNEKIRDIATKVSKFINLDFLEDLPEIKYQSADLKMNTPVAGNYNIYVAKDSAFNFYYEDSMDTLRKIGNVYYFSPLKNEVPEDADFIYLGGGYPELYSDELSRSYKTLDYIRDFSESGKIIVGECGGLMYMESGIETANGTKRMLGIFRGTVEKNGILTIGYTQMKVVKDSPLFKKNDIVRGHEFHYSSIVDDGEKSLRMEMGKGINGMDGLISVNSFGSYSHFSLSRYSKRLLYSLINSK